MKKEQKKLKINFKTNTFLRIKFISIFTLCLVLVATIIAIWNVDKLATFMPARYISFFSKINDAVFGKVQIIEIKGNKIISRNEILNHAYKNKVFEDDINLIKNELEIIKSLKKHPLVEYISIKRFLPNKMVIYIKEKNLIIRLWNSKLKKFYSITSSGEIVDFHDSKLNLPLVIDDFKTQHLIKLHEEIAKYNLQQYVTDITSFFNYRFNIVLNRKTIVNLPEKHLDLAFKNLVDLIDNQDILSKDIKQIDLRIQNKIFIKYFDKKETKTYAPIPSFKVLTW